MGFCEEGTSGAEVLGSIVLGKVEGPAVGLLVDIIGEAVVKGEAIGASEVNSLGAKVLGFSEGDSVSKLVGGLLREIGGSVGICEVLGCVDGSAVGVLVDNINDVGINVGVGVAGESVGPPVDEEVGLPEDAATRRGVGSSLGAEEGFADSVGLSEGAAEGCCDAVGSSLGLALGIALGSAVIRVIDGVIVVG